MSSCKWNGAGWYVMRAWDAGEGRFEWPVGSYEAVWVEDGSVIERAAASIAERGLEPLLDFMGGGDSPSGLGDAPGRE